MPDPDPTANGDVGEAAAPVAPATPDLRLALFELQNYRRLQAVRLEVGAETTVLVGPNDSGKTSLMMALRSFLSVASAPKSEQRPVLPFTGYDLCGTHWSEINRIGEEWLPEPVVDPGEDEAEKLRVERQGQWERLVGLMPSLDVWIDVAPHAWQRVLDLIPSLSWEGGLVGLRLRLEPATDGVGLEALIEAHRLANKRDLRDDGTTGSEITLVQLFREHPKLLGRLRAYRLDPQKLAPATGADLPGQATPQLLRTPSQRLAWGEGNDAPPLRGILRVDALAAQRGHGTEEADPDHRGKDAGGQLSKQLVGFVTATFGNTASAVDPRDDGRYGDVLREIRKVNDKMSTELSKALKEPLDKVRELVGYPNLSALQDLHLRALVNPGEALRHRTALRYRTDESTVKGHDLPEHAIGLGYQNLLSMSFWLLQQQEGRLRGAEDDVHPPPIHLVLMEEPEAHLHVQVQRVFITKARQAVHPADRRDLATQLLVSTHSSHLAHAVDFADLRYLRRLPSADAACMPTTQVVSLGATFSTEPTAEQETRRFVRRYLEVQHNDLLFADGVIVVEGAAERILIPEWIRRDHAELQRRYLSVLEVGGSHAHRFLPLLDRLQLPTLLITDLDPMSVNAGTPAATVPDAEAQDVDAEDADPEDVRAKRSPYRFGTGQRTSNPALHTLIGQPGQHTSADYLVALDPAAKLAAQHGYLRVAYQCPPSAEAPCGSSFEDALVLENQEWFRTAIEARGALGTVRRVVEKATTQGHSLEDKLHELMGKPRFKKGELAIELFIRLEKGGPACPHYIREGLSWLSQRLCPPPAEAPPPPSPGPESAKEGA